MALPRPPDPPNQSKHASRKDLVDGMDLEDTPQARLPEKPTTSPPSSVFLTFLEGIIGNPNHRLADGAMMEAEATRLSQLERRVALLEFWSPPTST
ncbi:uncharacterized protein VP01_2527g7 [Puccinia sorghi]|uniref:Uncharacterized protein n=1 Tax=Puccinia sorghi TaxID=27349 RepID=A0A0L6V5J9_9BASI|nr:uncharacterized protein VP01_2527g7 [Puccinia sorghi]